MTVNLSDIGVPSRDPAQGRLSRDPAQGRLRMPRAGGFYRRRGKRALDLGLVLLSLPVVLPLVALLALLVMIDGGAPFYSQLRLGRDGRVFRIWKLRSMVPGADALLAAHLAADPEARAEWAARQKLRRDPRITRLGHVLRKSSLDELPQLFNVVNGTMSLVGPRPMMLDQESLYPGRAFRLQRPGITGLWQISKRNESTFAARARFDAVYDRRLGLKLDLWILLRTVRVVLRGTGC